MVANISNALAVIHPSPSKAQRDAGNYRKGKLRVHGLLISIENRKGSRRDPKWKPLAAHYGYINRTEGRDGDHVDVFLGPKLDSEIVFVIDQVGPGGRFDEHKVMIGWTSSAKAKSAYLANYPAGWRCGPVTAMTIDQFKAWLAKGDTTRRVGEQVSRYRAAGVPNSYDVQSTNRIGETKVWNGKTYRLNENHRWELADPIAATADPTRESAQPQDSPADDQAARQKFVASKIGDVHPELGGLISAIHQSPHYKSSGEYASFDVHEKVAGKLHKALSGRAGQKFGGGQAVDLGEGRMGFASAAGSVVVWPADESGKHRVSYTNKTGIVGRAMAGKQTGEPSDGNAQSSQPLGTAESPFEAEAVNAADEPEAPPLPEKYPGGGESPFRQPPRKPQQNPSSAPNGKLSDEQAYDDSLTAPKEKPAHVLLRRRANASKEKFREAFDTYEQAVHDRERPDRVRKLKRHAVHLREIYNEHHRQATRAEGEHRGRLRESGRATKARMKELGIGPYKPRPKAEKPPKEPKPARQPRLTTKPSPAEKPVPLLDQAEKNPGAGEVPGNVPTASPEAMAAAKENPREAGPWCRLQKCDLAQW